MIVVDSSVWIDYFRGDDTRAADHLDSILGVAQVLTGDLVLCEVLRGFDADKDFVRARRLMTSLPVVALSDGHIAVAAAQNYRLLRSKGHTIRKTIDVLIATRCIIDGLTLLYSDRDFDPFVTHLGLRSALASPV